MAVPISFKPAPVDPRLELMKQLEAAPKEHAEALLELFRTLQTAHDKGILGLAHGLIGGKDVIAAELGKGMKSEEGIAGIRNAIAMARILGSLDPDVLQKIADGFGETVAAASAEKEPPGMWEIFKRATSKDARRGMSFGLRMLSALGRATQK
ncbi:MAG: DUF1641 domain-containing protein [Acidobacteriaceae bacterium]|nr:DUF1641 domain-containing protein [Acidobacteriaceae bacterium]